MILNLAYRSIIIILILLLVVFLFFGNYNLVEGMTLEEELNEYKDLVATTDNEYNNSLKIEDHYFQHDMNRKRQIAIEDRENKQIEGFTPARMDNECSTNYSELGVSNNMSNRMANIQCEALKTMKKKNNDVLGKEYKKDYEKYVTKN